MRTEHQLKGLQMRIMTIKRHRALLIGVATAVFCAFALPYAAGALGLSGGGGTVGNCSPVGDNSPVNDNSPVGPCCLPSGYQHHGYGASVEVGSPVSQCCPPFRHNHHGHDVSVASESPLECCPAFHQYHHGHGVAVGSESPVTSCPTPTSTTTTAITPSTTAPPSTTTTVAPTTTTAPTPAAGGDCTDPVWSSSDAEGTYNVDPNDAEYWWVNNDAWNGSAGPQSIYVCNQSSWYAVSNQPDVGGAVETYPDTEYDVGGRNSLSTKPISQYNSITSTFSEEYPSAGSWDAAYDLWLNNWSIETMIWNQWSGSQDYWPDQATISLSLDGVPYKFYDNGGELMFFRQTQVTSGSVDILAAYDWLVDNGYVKASDVPTQLEYGVEICSTNGNETFPMTGLTFSTS